jgi:hypothetical protein
MCELGACVARPALTAVAIPEVHPDVPAPELQDADAGKLAALAQAIPYAAARPAHSAEVSDAVAALCKPGAVQSAERSCGALAVPGAAQSAVPESVLPDVPLRAEQSVLLPQVLQPLVAREEPVLLEASERPELLALLSPRRAVVLLLLLSQEALPEPLAQQSQTVPR